MSNDEITKAAERRRRSGAYEDPETAIDEVYADDRNGPFEDQVLLANAMERELDPTPVDEAWASSAGFTPDPNEPGMLCIGKVWLIFDEQRQQCLSVYVDGFRIHDPSVGQVRTALRLASITLKDQSNAQQ